MQRTRSLDGTGIAYWTSGQGPSLVLVHGAAGDHTRWGPLLPYLEPHFTVYAMDRRGRGASGDASAYGRTREFEDVAAVVDTVAAASGASVYVYGHSHGAHCAFGAASRTSNIRKLVLYEGWPVPDPTVYALPAQLEKQLEALLTAGERERVVEVIFRELLRMSDEDMAAFKAAPSWPGRVAAAHTIAREIRAESEDRLDPNVAASLPMPVMLVTGENSADASKAYADVVAQALSNARVVMLEGQEHVADVLAPAMFAELLVSWLLERE